jgi:hypothetical protein
MLHKQENKGKAVGQLSGLVKDMPLADPQSPSSEVREEYLFDFFLDI